jgi:hypothetical protein
MIQYNRATMCKGGIVVPLSKEKPQACAVLLSSLLLLPKHYKLTACSVGWWLMAGAGLF